MTLRILLEEEYGYRTWLWEYPGTKEQLIADWKAGRAPMNFFDPSQGKAFIGTMTEILHITALPVWDYYAHTHEDSDTYLDVADVHIPGYPSKSPNSVPSKCEHCQAVNTVEYLGQWDNGLGNVGTDWWCSECDTNWSKKEDEND